MNRKQTILATGVVLWVLGVLVGASAADLLPGNSLIPSQLLLTIALLASVGNFVAFHKKAGER